MVVVVVVVVVQVIDVVIEIVEENVVHSDCLTMQLLTLQAVTDGDHYF